MIPGEIISRNETIVLNAGLVSASVTVTHTGDRPIQIGSHFHFFEVNRFLEFDRSLAFGFRPDIPSGAAVRFEPGETKTVRLVRIAGKKRIRGLNNLTDAQANASTREASLEKARARQFDVEKGLSHEY